MPQEFQVLQCFSCQTFQVHQVKKALKWACKLCGEKQSIKKVFGRGTGAECRQHVQYLNTLRGEMDQARGNLETRGRDLTDEGYIQKDSPDRPSHEQTSHNKWQAYIDDDVAADDEDVESEDGASLYTTDAREAIQFRRGAKRKSPSDAPISKRRKQEYDDWGSDGSCISRQKYTDSSEYNHGYRNHQPISRSRKHFNKPDKLTPSYNDRPATDRFAVPAAAIYEVNETDDADEEYNTLMSQQPGLKQQLVTTHTDALRCQDHKFRSKSSTWKTVSLSGFKDQIDNVMVGPRLSTGIGMSKWASFTTVQPITKEFSQEELTGPKDCLEELTGPKACLEELTGPKDCLQSSQDSEQDRSTWDELGEDLSAYSGQDCDSIARGQGQGSHDRNKQTGVKSVGSHEHGSLNVVSAERETVEHFGPVTETKSPGFPRYGALQCCLQKTFGQRLHNQFVNRNYHSSSYNNKFQSKTDSNVNCMDVNTASKWNHFVWNENVSKSSCLREQFGASTLNGENCVKSSVEHSKADEASLGEKCGTDTLTGGSLSKPVMKPFKTDKENFDLNNFCSVNPVSEGENSGCQFAPLEATSNISSSGYYKVDDKMLQDNLPGIGSNHFKMIGKLYNQETVGSLFNTGDFEDFDFEL